MSQHAPTTSLCYLVHRIRLIHRPTCKQRGVPLLENYTQYRYLCTCTLFVLFRKQFIVCSYHMHVYSSSSIRGYKIMCVHCWCRSCVCDLRLHIFHIFEPALPLEEGSHHFHPLMMNLHELELAVDM